MKKLFFIGICGVSMSALAVLMKYDGYEVVGCDKNHKRPPKSLLENGITVLPEKRTKEISTCDLVVFSSAIKDDNSVLQYAKNLNKKCISRGELLGRIASKFEKVIAISGSHGKTTTSGMIFSILKYAGKEPSLHLGGILCEEKTNVILGEKEFFVCEACEYFDNFLYLFPYIAVVTNIEREHLDYFKTFENEKKSYEKFKEQSKTVVDKTSFYARRKRINSFGGVSFDLWKKDKKLMEINLKVGGFYNIQNALFAIEVAQKLGISNEITKIGLERFFGTQKRLERREILGKTILVDYAHHPTEIECVQKYLRFFNKKIVAIFQPHTYSRTKNFCDDFVKVLKKFDKVFLYKTYPAREKPKDGLSAFELSNLIEKSVCLTNKKEVENIIKNSTEKEIVVLFGAGDLPEKMGLY